MNQSIDEKPGTNDSREDKYSKITQVVSGFLAPLGVTWAKEVQAEVEKEAKGRLKTAAGDATKQ